MRLPSPSILAALYGVSELCLLVTRRSGSGSLSKDRRTLPLLWAVILPSLGLAFVAASGLRAWDFTDPERFHFVGFCFFGLGMAWRWYSIIYLGRFFTTDVAISTDHRVVDSGPYRLVRHPSYSGSLLAIVGLGLSLGNPASLAILVIPVFLAFLWRIKVEEQALIEGLGDRYRSYMDCTKRLVPYLF